MLFLQMLLINRWASGYQYADIDRLISHLFNESRYKNYIRPVLNQSQAVAVSTYVIYMTIGLDKQTV